MLILGQWSLQHGECYVTDDGAEADLDLGHTRDLQECLQKI